MVLHLFALTLALQLGASQSESEGEGEAQAQFDVPHREAAPPLSKITSLPASVDILLNAQPGPDGHLWAPRKPGAALEQLTIDAALQRRLTDLMRSYETPYAAVVAIEPSTGRVLAMAEHAASAPALRGLCTKAVYPAASVFKVVTAAALLESGLTPQAPVCFYGGKRKVLEAQLDDSVTDLRCLTLAEALGKSANVAFAKLTAKYLDPGRLKAAARAAHFNAPIAFAVPTDSSLAAIPDETYPLSLTGAGFGDVYLSALHGALLASIPANGGNWQSPILFEGDLSSTERVMATEVAAQLTSMMEETISSGTGHRIFNERGLRVPGAVGKTGSLADKRPFRDYTWFIGFAPKDAPRVAVAAVIVNDARWRIRATWLAREAMRLYLERR